jgi:pyridoxal phosphate enzyme (YggS family)
MADEIRERLAVVKERIELAAQRAGRTGADVTLVAVSKTVEAAVIQRAVDAGVRDLGENRVQEALRKAPQVSGSGLRWHLIGHLQSNKARSAVATFDTIHSVDSVELARGLDRVAGQIGRRPRVLAQLKVSEEATKSGAEEETLGSIIETLDAAQHLDLKGLMAIPPAVESAEEARPYFRRLRLMLEDLNRSRTSECKLTELSMGMSHDFEIAIEEGATMVRVGTAIFGSRQKA